MNDNRKRAVDGHLDLIDMYVQRGREHPDEAQQNLTWIRQAVEAIRRELSRDDVDQYRIVCKNSLLDPVPATQER